MSYVFDDKLEICRQFHRLKCWIFKSFNRTFLSCFFSSGTCNGVAVWMDYSLDNSRTISTGLMSPPVEGEELRWYPFSKQGVHFFKQPEVVDITNEQRHWKLRHKVTFRPKTGEIELQFVVTSENWSAPVLVVCFVSISIPRTASEYFCCLRLKGKALCKEFSKLFAELSWPLAAIHRRK